MTVTTVTFINTSGRMKAFALPHETYCQARGSCACTIQQDLNARTTRRVASSLTLAANARLEGLSEAVLAVPEIERALRTGNLRVERKRADSTGPSCSDPIARPRGSKSKRGDA
ncbi:MAG: hypothetical protein V2A73_16460 [Pseudomonadota bacterium]